MKFVKGWALQDCDVLFSKEISKTGSFQIERLREALKFVTDFSVAIDGGAHIGLWSKVLAFNFEKVISFEPAADSFECLSYNMYEERVSGLASLRNEALGDECTTAAVQLDPLREPQGNTGSRFVRKGQEEGAINMVTIDSLNLPSLGFLKLDVEGAEYLALKGGARTIAKYKPVVFVEVKKQFGEERFGVARDAPLKFLMELGAKEVARIKSDHIFAF